MTSLPGSLQDCIEYGADLFAKEGLFFGHGTDNAWDEAAVLALWRLGLNWGDLETRLASPLSAEHRLDIQALFEKRARERIPAAYITGEAWFAGHRFKVNSDVLVPRSPIAELIHRGFSPWLEKAPMRILDLCCGSGCIGIACALEFSGAEVVLTDISKSALAVASDNVSLHGLESRVSLVESDGFKDIQGEFDLIVSNPPYVDKNDLEAMPAEFQAEPALGLYSGADGLNMTRRILREAHGYLHENASLVCEVGNSMCALEKAFPALPFMWPEFEYGGHGVFILSQRELPMHSGISV